MTNKSNVTTQRVHPTSLIKRVLQGAGIALTLIIIFLLGVDESDPDWPRFWMMRPLIIVPLAGALGGVFYYFMDHLRYEGRWKKILANFLSLIGYLIALWLGTVLGLDGTLWN